MLLYNPTFDLYHGIFRFLQILENLEQKESLEIEKQLSNYGGSGRTVTIKVKFSDFTQVTRSHSSQSGFRSADAMMNVVPELLDNALTKPLAVRLLGISISNLVPDSERIGDEQIPLL